MQRAMQRAERLRGPRGGAFQTASRRHNGEAQMRNMVRAMTAKEIDEVAAFYAGKASPAQTR